MDTGTILTRRVAEIIDRKHLESALRSGKKLRVKLGIDPNRPDLHLGHAVPLWKLREFQEAGHKAGLIIGDWTAMIGDPSGRDETRPQLSRKEVEANAKKFFAQAYLILDKAKTEIHLQSEWFKKFGLAEVMHLESLVTEKQLLAHETFRERIEKDLPFRHHETLYPLLQGYDSVAIRADVELGALEQKFNVLMGRRIQKAYGQKQQDVLLLDYLIGLDGKEKMSKSLGNYIALTDSPEEMFGKVMSIPDNLIGHYFELCTEVPEKGIKEIKKQQPRDQKVRLAKEIVGIYHGKKRAERAEGTFEAKFGKGGKGKGKIKPDFELKRLPGIYDLVEIMVAGKLTPSKSEGRRKIKEGAVEVDGTRIFDEKAMVKITKSTLVRLGKRVLRII